MFSFIIFIIYLPAQDALLECLLTCLALHHHLDDALVIAELEHTPVELALSEANLTQCRLVDIAEALAHAAIFFDTRQRETQRESMKGETE
jgi:hypothetical protein